MRPRLASGSPPVADRERTLGVEPAHAPAPPEGALVRRREWRLAAVFVGVFALVEAAVAVLAPAYRLLAWFALYTAISNFCIPWLPHEPAVILYGKLYDPWMVALVGGVATCWMEYFNYRLLGYFARLPRVQAFMSGPSYRRVEGYFSAYPFLSLVVAGLLPVPFAPFRVLAVTSRYPMARYQLAVFAGRTPRYVVLASVGAVLSLPWWAWALICLAFTVPVLWPGLLAGLRAPGPSPVEPVEGRENVQ